MESIAYNTQEKKRIKESGNILKEIIVEQVKEIIYLGIIFDGKVTFRDHVIYIEEDSTKLIFTLSKSAILTWGLKHMALLTIYAGSIQPIILYEAQVLKVLRHYIFIATLSRAQRLINIRIAKAYRTVSNEALCVITFIIPINLKIEKPAK
ncbi:MAG: hypothetical protein FWC68_02565 [Oscillospiraceae bacterium]|nr:hypothetical protein [Oscillospiraceae bacterium]